MADHFPCSEFVAKIALFNDELNSLRPIISELEAKVKDQGEVILMLKQRLHDNSSKQFTSPMRTSSVPQQQPDGSSGHHENGGHTLASHDNIGCQKDNHIQHGVDNVSLATNDPNNAPEEELDVSYTQIINVAFDLYDLKDTNLSTSKDSNNDASRPHTSNSFLNQDGKNNQPPKVPLHPPKPIVFKQPVFSVPEERPKRRLRSPITSPLHPRFKCTPKVQEATPFA